ncbi:MAG: Slp family lipoprotein [Nitrospira sp.]|nr:Slp family lipoprotein [Nitrospira sp.]
MGMLTMYLWLAACTTTPLFPPEITNDIENDTFGFKAWKEQASYPSDNILSQKVELEGHILKVIPTRAGFVILADGRPVHEQLSYDSKDGEEEDPFRFAIIFNGTLDADMLQAGNSLVVVGATDKASPEVVGWMQKVLPHLRAQCLHIWKDDENEIGRFRFGKVKRYPQEERTFCLESSIGKPTTEDQ